jgi:cysteinyl-tRNA synthetase
MPRKYRMILGCRICPTDLSFVHHSAEIYAQRSLRRDHESVNDQLHNAKVSCRRSLANDSDVR